MVIRNFSFFKLIILILAFHGSFFSNGQTWTVSHVDRSGDGSVEIRVDVNNPEIHVLTKGNFDQLYYYHSPDHGKSWKKTELGEITHRTFEVGEISSLIDQKGAYHIAYFSPDNDIVHAVKTGSDSWTRDTILKNPVGNYRDAWHRIFLDIDSKNNVHAFFKDYNVLKYFVLTGQTWVSRDVKLDNSGAGEYTFDIDVFDRAHVVCTHYDERLYHY